MHFLACLSITFFSSEIPVAVVISSTVKADLELMTIFMALKIDYELAILFHRASITNM
jgi:hypothetical protein